MTKKGTLVISNPTVNITFTITGVSQWEYPTQEGENLTITQTYSVNQSGTNLEVQ